MFVIRRLGWKTASDPNQQPAGLEAVGGEEEWGWPGASSSVGVGRSPN